MNLPHRIDRGGYHRHPLAEQYRGPKRLAIAGPFKHTNELLRGKLQAPFFSERNLKMGRKNRI